MLYCKLLQTIKNDLICGPFVAKDPLALYNSRFVAIRIAYASSLRDMIIDVLGKLTFLYVNIRDSRKVRDRICGIA